MCLQCADGPWPSAHSHCLLDNPINVLLKVHSVWCCLLHFSPYTCWDEQIGSVLIRYCTVLRLRSSILGPIPLHGSGPHVSFWAIFTFNYSGQMLVWKNILHASFSKYIESPYMKLFKIHWIIEKSLNENVCFGVNDKITPTLSPITHLQLNLRVISVILLQSLICQKIASVGWHFHNDCRKGALDFSKGLTAAIILHYPVGRCSNKPLFCVKKQPKLCGTQARMLGSLVC